MVATRPFRVITSASTDAPIEVTFGAPQAVALAQWDRQLQVWIRVGDRHRRPLQWVTGWRPVTTERTKP
jgi:hypothetical protein